MNYKIIALSGGISSGKTTAATFLKKYVPEYEVVAFADSLKNVASILLDLPIENFNTIDGKNQKTELSYEGSNITVRHFLQIFATELMRNNFGENFWINLLFKKIKTNVIIHDCRFKNEADEILKRGGIIIRLDRNLEVSKSHSSENDLDDYEGFKYKYINDGTLEDLHKFLLDVLKQEKLI